MYAVVSYIFDLNDLTTEFDKILFVTKDINLANKHKEENHDKYIGYDRYREIVIREVVEK